MNTLSRLALFTFIFMCITTSVLEAKTLLIVHPFCPDDLTNESKQLYDSLVMMSLDGITIERTRTVSSLGTLMELNEDKTLSFIIKYANKHKIDYILFTELSHATGQIYIEYKLFSRENKQFIATSFDWILYNTIELFTHTLEKRLSLLFQSKILKIVNINVIGDSSLNQITVSFETFGNSGTFAILRSLLREGPYDIIATTTSTTYTDTDVQPGTVYWYKVQLLVDGYVIDSSPATSACIIPENKENLDLDKVLSLYKKTDEKPDNEEQKLLFNTHSDLLKPLYMNSVKLRIIMQIVKSYISKGQLTILKDFDAVVMDIENFTIYLIKKNHYVVKLESKKPFELLLTSNWDVWLLRRLLLNAIAFGAQDGIIEITDEEGYTAQLPLYQSIGIATTYFKEYKNWPGNTILWSTSNKELKEKMKEYSNQ